MVDTTNTTDRETAVSDLSEAGAPNGIEVTPAMIEAGASVLAGFDTYFTSEEIWAERVYRAMRAADASR